MIKNPSFDSTSLKEQSYSSAIDPLNFHAKTHEDWMRLAILLTNFANGQTGSNPCVGAVIVKEGRLLGFGCHLKQGEAHAEIYALAMAGDKAKGATLYVTLEPCCHYGLTGPCSKAVIQAGISSVFIAVRDVDPKVSGRGIKALEDAGIQVEVGLLEQEAKKSLWYFFATQKLKRSYVILKTASSLDGKLALYNKESQWVTSEAARVDVHHLRATCDGILTAIGTVNSDDPRLNVRLPQETRQPVRLILDKNGEVSVDANIIKSAQEQRTILFGFYEPEHAEILMKMGCEIIALSDLPSIFEWTWQAGLMTIMIEAGPRLVSTLLDAGFVDEWIAYQSPRVFGGEYSLYVNHKKAPLNEIETFQLVSSEIIGDDLKITMRNKTSDPFSPE